MKLITILCIMSLFSNCISSSDIPKSSTSEGEFVDELYSRPTKKEASKGLDGLIEAMKIENCVIDKEIISMLN